VAVHTGALLCLWYLPRTVNVLLAVNGIAAVVVLCYAISRARYILAGRDWPYVGLCAFELLVLAGAILAFRHNRPALIGSYVAFGVHFLASVAFSIFTFTFKITRLI
jgi:hypothetical protein